ncbi:MAG: peroxiredoxin [Thiogranum sp.]
MLAQCFRLLPGMLLMVLFFGAQADDLKPGDPAPAFELRDQHGKMHHLSDYQGQWLVLYFYPKDDTPGCTSEACEFRDDFMTLQGMDVRLLGVSLDDVKSHKEFAEKYHLPFPLLSDRTGEVARVYGSLWKLGPIRFARRHTFIIDPQGRMAKIYRSVAPKTHSDQVIGDLENLRSRQ